jgi:hypothetical protein
MRRAAAFRLGAALAAALAVGACRAPLEGEVAAEPVPDWSFVRDAGEVAFATRSGRAFRMVRAVPFVVDGALHLYVSSIFAAEDPALLELLEDPLLRVGVGGRIHETRAVRLAAPEEITPVLPALLRDAMRVEAVAPRYEPSPPRYPGTQIRQWFFRLESAPPARSTPGGGLS